VADVGRFDHLVNELTDRASNRKPGSPRQKITGVLANLGVAEEDKATVEATYNLLCDLHDQGQNHIWGYYIRNQSRPTWLSRSENRVDVLIGNPPWLAGRFMSASLQKVFQRRAKERGLWMGGARSHYTTRLVRILRSTIDRAISPAWRAFRVRYASRGAVAPDLRWVPRRQVLQRE